MRIQNIPKQNYEAPKYMALIIRWFERFIQAMEKQEKEIRSRLTKNNGKIKV